MTANLTPPNDNVVKVLLENGDDDDDDEKEHVCRNDEAAEEIVMMKMAMNDGNDEKMPAVGLVGKQGKSECREERPSWSSKREYILTVLGYIVGIGNIWRFPYMCNRNGGGAFLLPFLLCLTIVGFPLFFLETALGQFTSKSPLHVWSICPLVKGAGISMCLMAGMMVWYFNTIMAWALYYLVSSFKSEVPWSLCGQWWNTPQCTVLSHGRNATSANGTSGWNVTSSDWRNSTSTWLTEPGPQSQRVSVARGDPESWATGTNPFWLLSRGGSWRGLVRSRVITLLPRLYLQGTLEWRRCRGRRMKNWM